MMLGQVIYHKDVEGLWSWKITLWLSDKAIISAHTLTCASAFGSVKDAISSVDKITNLLNIKLLGTKAKKTKK